MKHEKLGRTVTAQAQFLTWLQNTQPEVYGAVVSKIVADKDSGQLGQAEEVKVTVAPDQTFWEKVTTGLMAVGTSILAYKSQRDLLKLNLARAEAGLPPLDAGAVAPVIRTEISLPPEMISELTKGAGLQFNKVLLWGGAALAAFLIFK